MSKDDNLFANMGLSDYSYLLEKTETASAVPMAQPDNPKEKLMPISELVPFKNHPFHVDTEDEEFCQLVESIKENGVIYPILIRPQDDKYEIIAGHCRMKAAEIAGLREVPVIIRGMSDYEATVIMVHSNISGRAKIKISEKAKAYRMCMDAEKHQGKVGVDTAAMVGNGQDSKRQVYRYVRLSYLTDDFLQLVDDKKIPVITAIELAYLDEESQDALYEFIENFNQYPTTAQAAHLREIFEKDEEAIPYGRIMAELLETPKKKAVTKVSFKTKELENYFDKGTDAEHMSNIILMLLSKYRNGDFDGMLEQAE